MSGPLLFGALVALFTMIAFLGFWRAMSSLDPVQARVKEYGLDGELRLDAQDESHARQGIVSSGLLRLANLVGLGPRLATRLARAGVALTAGEFTLVMLGASALGLVIGVWRLGVMGGLALGGFLGYAPMFFLRILQGRRQRAFSDQLPDVLTMLVGALRAGYGLSQAVQFLVEHFPPPASEEFDQVIRAVDLGVAIEKALSDMVRRVGTEELELVVTAINVQHETGGNLAETLEIIADTIRDRVRIQREIGVFTAQQQLTGYILAALPVALAVILSVIDPQFFRPFFEPGWARLLPLVAVAMQVVGFVVMRRILKIEV